MNRDAGYPNTISEPILDDISWTNTKRPHRSGCPPGDLLYIFMGPDRIDRNTCCPNGRTKFCPALRGGNGESPKMGGSLLFFSKFILGEEREMDNIFQRLNIFRLQPRLLKLLSIEFRIPITPPQLEFEFVKLESLKFLSIHQFDFRVKIFSDFHGSPLNCGMRIAEFGMRKEWFYELITHNS
jgi:hypothetical protein